MKLKTKSQRIADKINKAHGWKEGSTGSFVTAEMVDGTLLPSHPIDAEIALELAKNNRCKRRKANV